MKRKDWIRAGALLAAFAVLGTSAVLPAAAETPEAAAYSDSAEKYLYTGSCGESAVWVYNKKTETLLISGTGAVEDYAKDGVQIKTPTWCVGGIPYAARNVVVQDGITALGEGFWAFCFSGTETSAKKTVRIAESVQDMETAPLLHDGSVTFYGKIGSWFYNQFVHTNRFVDVETGQLVLPETSGVYTDGAAWSYDTDTNTLTISGDGGITESEYVTNFGMGEDAEKVIIGKDVRLPQWISKQTGTNLFLHTMLSDACDGCGPALYLYHDSDAGRAYDALIQHCVENGVSEESAKLSHPAAFLDDALLCGDVNFDGKIDMTDAVLISKAVSGSVSMDGIQKIVMDCDGDGDITTNDAAVLVRFLVHLEDTLPPVK